MKEKGGPLLLQGAHRNVFLSRRGVYAPQRQRKSLSVGEARVFEEQLSTLVGCDAALGINSGSKSFHYLPKASLYDFNNPFLIGRTYSQPLERRIVILANERHRHLGKAR